jgi:hypothetical protein
MKIYIAYLCVYALLPISSIFAGESINDAWGSLSNNVQMSIGLKGGDRAIKTNEEFRLLPMSGHTNLSLFETTEVSESIVQ